ncbi:hypothetical protein E2C01_016539 [Portunus trituberculatus]|uniref:Uncharacterized protein n=1 Tax=Portunus trituberculatus TaxID=210409 RepID=A0A5B7DQZ8_PORTR|nr:hypothetical protein [Portunus trituberculatus]
MSGCRARVTATHQPHTPPDTGTAVCGNTFPPAAARSGERRRSSPPGTDSPPHSPHPAPHPAAPSCRTAGVPYPALTPARKDAERLMRKSSKRRPIHPRQKGHGQPRPPVCPATRYLRFIPPPRPTRPFGHARCANDMSVTAGPRLCLRGSCRCPAPGGAAPHYHSVDVTHMPSTTPPRPLKHTPDALQTPSSPATQSRTPQTVTHS